MQARLVPDYLAKTAQDHPHHAAITDGTKTISFQELAEHSDRLAGFLSGVGVARGDRVIYYMDRGPECLTATVAILKSGAIYIPLDSKTPPDRLSRIVQDSNPRVIL